MSDSESAGSGWRFLLLALLCGLAAALPLLIGPGIVNTRAGGDSPFLLLRVHQLVRNLDAGILPARWMPDAAYGLGYPAFHYYAALPYYLASLLARAGLGILWGIKVTQALGFLLAAWASYGLARDWELSPAPATLVAAAYTFAPFHLVNVYVRGDALSEFWAMALYPLLLWLATRLGRRPSPSRVAALGLAYAALVLSHNISAMLFSPVLVLALFIEGLRRPASERRTVWLGGAVALALGLAASAWFWAPALGEASLVQLGDQTTGYLHYAGHFRDLDQVQRTLLHNYAIGDGADPFRMGAVQAAVAFVGLALLALRTYRQRRVPIGATLGVVVLFGTTWLMTSSSEWAWASVPLLAFTQFPWRLLGIQALATSLLAAELPHAVGRRAAPYLALGLALLLALAGLARLRLDRLPLREGDVTVERLMFYETYSGNIGGTIRHEYLPRTMEPRPYTSAAQWNDGHKPPPLVLEGSLRGAERQSEQPDEEVWVLAVEEPALVAFHTTYFPGWEAEVDGVREEVEPLAGLGLIGLRLEPGEHRVRLHLGVTPVRRRASWASVLGLLVLAALIVQPAWRDRRYRQRLVAAALAAALCLGWVAWAQPPRSQRQASGPVVADIDRAPYLHGEPEGIIWVGPIRLLGYTMSSTRLAPGESLAVTLHWDAPHPDVDVELALLGATSHLLRPGPVWAVAQAPLDRAETTVTLQLPPHLAPGLYVLRPELLAAGDDLDAYSVDGHKLGRLILQPIQVVGAVRATGAEEIEAAFGPPAAPPEVALLDVRAEAQGRQAVVRLLWCAERQAAKNYWLSLRLRRSDGADVAVRDVPPLLGGCPTSLWEPGALIEDRVILRLPDGESIQADDTLDVVLYDRQTLQAIGTATFAGLFR